MPIYEFRCTQCKKDFEYLVLGSGDEIACPECNGENVKRLMSSCSFKSSGASSEPSSSSASSCSGCSASSCAGCH